MSKYSGVAREVLEALLDKYMNTGIYEIEKTEILKLDPFKKYGKPSKIARLFRRQRKRLSESGEGTWKKQSR